MESVKQVIESILGGDITGDKIFTIFVAFYALIKSVTEWRAKKKLINADKELTSMDKKLEAQNQELEEVKKSNAILANIIATAYLSSNTIDSNTKKEIAQYAKKAEQIAKVDITSMVSGLINTVAEHIPGTSLNEKKEEIKAEVKAREEILDSAIEGATSAIDAIKV